MESDNVKSENETGGRRRERRRATHLVNYYAREDELDAELNEDSSGDDAPAHREKRRRTAPAGGRPHASKICPGCGRTVGNASQICKHCDYTFATGSRKSSSTHAAAAASQQQQGRPNERKHPVSFVEEREADSGERIIDKIIGRIGEDKFGSLYLIKFKGVSAAHAEWLSAERIGQMGKRSKQIFHRFLTRDEEAPPIQSSFAIDRIVDVRVAEKEPLEDDGSDDEDDSAAGQQQQQRQQKKKLVAKPPIPYVQIDVSRQPKRVKLLSDAKQKKKRLETWRPMERCLHLVKKLGAMPEAEPFVVPVDATYLPDYEVLVPKPMDLGTIETRLARGNFYKDDPEAVLKDIRLTWSNCKNYNEQGSSIWRAAVVLGMATDRLYEAWVNSTKDDGEEGSGSAEGPPFRPWEPGCRGCQTRDDEVVLCDHCDAEYHVGCRLDESVRRAIVRFAGEKVWRGVVSSDEQQRSNEESWVCAVCCARSIRSRTRGASASVEDAYRETIRRALDREKSDEVVKKKIGLEYLVKWTDLSYKECTWETTRTLVEVDAARALKTFQSQRQGSMNRARLEMERRRCTSSGNGKGAFDERSRIVFAEGPAALPTSPPPSSESSVISPSGDARAILFAQLECFRRMCEGSEDLKDDDSLLSRCGPATYARVLKREDVGEALSRAVHCAARGTVSTASRLGPARPGEYDAVLPKTGGAVGLHLKHAKSDAVFPSLWVAKVPCGIDSPCAGIVGACDALVSCQGLVVDEGRMTTSVTRRFATTVNAVRAAPLYVHCRFRRSDMHSNSDAAQGSIEQLRRHVQAGSGALRLPKLMEFMPSSSIMSSLASISESRIYPTESLFGWTGVAIDASSSPGGWRAKGNLYPSALEAASALDAAERSELGHLAPQPRCAPGGRPGRARATPSTYRAGFLSNWAINRATFDAFFQPSQPSSFTSRTATIRLSRLLGVDLKTAETEEDDDQSSSDERVAADTTPEIPRPDPSRKLRDYQERGVAWMLDCRLNRRGSILADEMGLGKTAQICAYLQRLATKFNDRPCLVVAPLSTIGHWARELESWTSLTVCNYHDNGRDARDLRRHFEWWPKDDQDAYRQASRNHDPKNTAFDVLVTTYDELIRDADELCSVAWASCAVDEAHRLKNEKGRLIESLHFVLSLGVKQRHYQHRVLLTGTPLQNDTKELWTLMNFIQHDKGIFARGEARTAFDSKFGQMETAEQVRELQGEIAPHLLRRVKEDVATDIPIKRETIIDVELTLAQKRYYRALYEKNVSALAALRRASNGGAPQLNGDEESSSSAAGAGSSMPTMNNLQMELRKCCNHPLLLRGVRDAELEKLQDELLQEQGREVFDAKSFQAHVGDRLLVPQAGKMVLLDKLLPKLRKEGHKVLIFSQMVKMLTLLAEFCQHRDYPYETLDGRVRGDERQRAIDRFNDPTHDSFVFLLSTRAGGVGVNLVAADTVIIYDSDWNPQNDVQAMARCHRLGQTKDVMVYRLVATRTFEGEMFDRASRKLGLERAVLSGDAFDTTTNGASSAGKKGANGPTANELEQLLRRGAYGLVEANDEAESRARAFCEADIEQILEERATVRVVEGEQTAGWLNKSSFSVENQDLNVNDPAFWEKAMPDMRTPELLLSRLDRGFASALPAKQRQQPADDVVKEPISEEEDEEAAASAAEIPEEGDGSPDEDEIDQQLKAAFVSDLEVLVAGALKRRYRGSLSDAERQSTMQLLLRASLDQAFSEKERAEASLWYKQLEGNRRRFKVVHLQQQQHLMDEDDDLEEDGDDDDDAREDEDEGNDLSDDDDDVDEDAEDEDAGAKSSKRRRRRDRRLNGDAPPMRKRHPKRKAAKKGSYTDGDEEEAAMIDEDADPRSLLARLDVETGEAFVSGKKLKKERSEILPEPPKPPPIDMIAGMISKVVKFEGTFFYVTRNDDTAGGVADMLGDSVDSASLVRLNKSRFSGLSKHARLMASTCLALPDSYSQAEADEFNENETSRPPVAPRRPNERYQSYAAASSNGKGGDYASGGAPYQVAMSTPAVAVFAPTPDLCGSCGGSGDIGTLVECKSCGIVVHCGCYGVDEDQYETQGGGDENSSSKRRSRTKKKKSLGDWTCDVCSHTPGDDDDDDDAPPRRKKSPKKQASSLATQTPNKPPCVLCSYRGGPMKRVENGGWAHVHCATFIPEVAFRDTTTMSPVCDIARIRLERFSAPCVLCGKAGHPSPLGGGPTVRCSRTGNATRCNAWIHPSCAFAAGCGLLIASDESSVYSDKISIIQYCPRHTTHFFPTPPPKFALLDETQAEEHAGEEEAQAETRKPRRASNGRIPLKKGAAKAADDDDKKKRVRRAAATKAAEQFVQQSDDDEDDDGGEDDDDEEEQEELCVCGKADADGDFFIGCDDCGRWYHPECVGIDPDDAEAMDSYTCDRCLKEKEGSRSVSRSSSRTRNNGTATTTSSRKRRRR